MKFLSVFLLLVVCLVGKGYSDIQCYECDDCGDLSDSQLQSCPAAVTTTIPPETTEAPSTTTQNADTSSSTSSTDQSSTSSSESVTSPSGSTEQITASPSEPETSPSVATESSTLSSAETAAPTGETAAPTGETAAPTGETAAPTGEESASQNEALGIVPNVIQALSSHRRTYRSVLRAGPTYHCYSLNRVDGDSQKVTRGCVEVPEDSTPCDVLKGEYGESIENCKSCQSDKCNSSAALKFSLVTFVIAIVIGVLCK